VFEAHFRFLGRTSAERIVVKFVLKIVVCASHSPMNLFQTLGVDVHGFGLGATSIFERPGFE
jgi:hypothetical protein